MEQKLYSITLQRILSQTYIIEAFQMAYFHVTITVFAAFNFQQIRRKWRV